MRSSHRVDVEHVADGLRAEEILAGIEDHAEILKSARDLRDSKTPPTPEAIARRQQRSRVLARRSSRDRRALAPVNTEPSARELEVLQLAANGLWNHEIGRELWITEETVKSHLRHLMPKLGSRNRAHAVALAIGRGLIEPPTERDA